MKVTEFNKLVCLLEAGKKEVNIAQVSEITKVMNKLTDGRLYKMIRKMEA